MMRCQVIPANFVVFSNRSNFWNPSGSYATEGKIIIIIVKMVCNASNGFRTVYMGAEKLRFDKTLVQMQAQQRNIECQKYKENW